METTALTLTSLPLEPATGIQTRIEAQPSGEFAKILQNQPAQAETPDGTPPEGKEGDPLPAAGKEIPLLMFSSLPVLFSEGKSPLGEKGPATASSGSQDLRNNGVPQNLNIPIPAAATQDGAAAGVQKAMSNENPLSPLKKSFNLGLSPNEGPRPAGSTVETPIPESGPAKSSPAEKGRITSLDPRLWHNPEGEEGALGDLKPLAKGDLANFGSEISVKGKDLFPNDINPADGSKPQDGAATGVQKAMSNENPSSPLKKSFNLGLSPNEGPWPAGSTAEIPIPENGPAKSSPAEKGRITSLDPRLWHNPEGEEGALGDLKPLAKGDLANFGSEISVKGKDLFPNDINPADGSKPASPKTGDLSGNLASPMERSATASSGSQDLRNNGVPQNMNISIPAAATQDGAATGVQKAMSNENPSSPLKKSFNLGLSPNEGPWPAGSTAEIPIPENGPAKSSPAEKGRITSLDPRLWHNPEGEEGALGDLKPLAKGDLANFGSEISVKGKDLFPNDINPADGSKPASPKTGDLSGNLAFPMERSATPHPAGEVRLEGTPGSSRPQKAEVYEQISQKMVWSLSQNEEKFRLILDPPRLGSIYLEIQRDKEQIKATLWAENPHTKQILESNQISIQKIIEREGFSLGSFNVFVEQDLGAFQESRERMGNPEPANSNPTAKANRELGSGPTAPPPFVGGSGGRLRSIDLII